MFWSRKRKKKIQPTRVLPPGHPFLHLHKKCQEDFFKSGLTEEEVVENYEIFLKIVIFTSKIHKEDRAEMRKTGMQMKQRYEQFVSSDDITIYPRGRTAATDDTFTKPRSKSINREFGDRPPLRKQRSRSIDAGNKKKKISKILHLPLKGRELLCRQLQIFLFHRLLLKTNENSGKPKLPIQAIVLLLSKKVSGVITPPPIRKTPPKTPNAPRNNPPTTNKTPAKKYLAQTVVLHQKLRVFQEIILQVLPPKKNIGHKVSKKKIGTQRWKLKLE